jgi:phosphoglycerol transferase
VRRGRSPAVGRADTLGLILAALGAMLAAAFSLQLWHLHLHIPMTYTWDGIFTEMIVKSAVNGGWIFTNHSLGAPLGTQLFDYPLGTDNLHWLIVKLMGIVTNNPARVMNVFFLLTFPADAIAGYAVFRWLRISVPASVVCSILFAVAPYHLLQGEEHIFLSEYVAVPIGAYLILSVLDGSSWSSIRIGGGVRSWRAWLPSRPVLRLLLCVLIGSIGVYYSVFTLVLVAIAGVLTAAARHTVRPLVPAAMVFIAIGGMIVIDDAPTIVYRHEHGTDTAVAQRLPQESEIYSLNLTSLVLPVPGDRIGPLNRLRERYDTSTPVPSAGDESLGLVAALGFLWLCGLTLASAIGFGRAGPLLERQRYLGFAALITLLTGTFGGISALIAYLVTPEIRVWDWISIFISFFALAAVGIGLDALRRRLGTARRWWAAAALAVVLGFGVYEQSSTSAIPPYAANAASYGSDGAFVDRIQSLVPHGAAVFELPYVPFPENPPVVRMTDYDEGRGYIQTTTGLRWSYGAMKGRPADWESQTTAMPVPTLMAGVVAAGFSGIWIDRFGYADNGVSLAGQIQAALGTPPIGSDDGRFLFFDLRAFATRLRRLCTPAQIAGLRDAMLHPPEITWGTGFYAPDADGALWAVPSAQATVDNDSRTARRVEFYSDVQTLDHGHYSLTVTAPGGAVGHFTITDTPHPIELAFTAPPGISTVSFASTAPAGLAPGDPRSLAVHYFTPIISGVALTPFLPAQS